MNHAVILSGSEEVLNETRRVSRVNLEEVLSTVLYFLDE